MTKRRHDQKPDPRLMVCSWCKDNKCGNCVDVLRKLFSDENICMCTRQHHAQRRDGTSVSSD